MSDLLSTDKTLYDLIKKEEERQRTTIRLIASENYASKAVLEASGSVFTNKYSEGYPTKRYYEGQIYVDEVEALAQQRAKDLFGVEHANVQPYSGSSANLATLLALAKPGDTVLGMGLAFGGHLTHGHTVSYTGKLFNAVQYSTHRETGLIDFDEVRELAHQHRPKIIIAGATAYPRIIDYPSFKSIADEVDAYLVVDIAHISGLVAGGAHPSPAEYGDIITSTTHKTLRGPRGGMILCREEYSKAIDRSVFPGMQGGPHDHTTAALAVALKEAQQDSFRDYAHQIVMNARALAVSLLERGYTLVANGTDNHLILVDLSQQEVSGKIAARRLDLAGIETNANSIPYDSKPPMDPSGLRLGTAAVASCGMEEKDMEWIAERIDTVIKDGHRDGVLDRVRNEVQEFCNLFKVPGLDG